MSTHVPAINLRKLIPLGVLAVLSIWFVNREPNEEATKPGLGFTKNVDYYLKGVTTEHFDNNGNLVYQLDAELAQHYRNNDSVELSKPAMRYRIDAEDGSNNADFWHIGAQQGWFYEEQPPRLARLELKDQVVIQRDDANGETITTQTEEMWFLPGSGELHSQSPVVIAQGNHRISANRLSISTKKDRIHLHGGVKGAYYPASTAR